MSPARWGSAALAALLACGGTPIGGSPVEVFLPPGSSFPAITDSLVGRGVVTRPGWFRLVARVGRFDRRVKAGYYEFPPGIGTLDLLRRLARGSEKTLRFTFPEGSTVVDLANLASARLGLSPDSIRAATRDSALRAELGVPGPTLEGFLHPETYFVSRLIGARQLVREMAQLFHRAWDPAWEPRRAELGLSRADLVTLASIVEAEAKADEDRPVIAAVYLNRLRRRMPLQADPTVQYALQLATGARKPRLLERDYGFVSPYNTYLHPGLPPGPVGAPGRRSIEAVLAPAEVPYLYFVAAPDGRHIFSRSYLEHLRAVARVRRMQREASRSTSTGDLVPPRGR
jgi:UPF0755 protein